MDSSIYFMPDCNPLRKALLFLIVCLLADFTHGAIGFPEMAMNTYYKKTVQSGATNYKGGSEVKYCLFPFKDADDVPPNDKAKGLSYLYEWHALGSVCNRGNPDPARVAMFRARGEAVGALAAPLGFSVIRNLDNTLEKAGTWWRADCPAGYAALANYLGSNDYPNVNDRNGPYNMKCVHVDFLILGRTHFHWKRFPIKAGNFKNPGDTAEVFTSEGVPYPPNFEAYSRAVASQYNEGWINNGNEMIVPKYCKGSPMCNGLGKCNYRYGLCECNPGYSGDPCVDVDECAVGSSSCERCLCTNTVGSYTCAPVLTFKVNITDVQCFGGSDGIVIVTASGGSGGYTYRYTQNGISSNWTTVGNSRTLSAGKVQVEVKDVRGCLTTNYYTINQPLILRGGVAKYSNPKCYDTLTGTILLQGTGGVQPYSYQYNDLPYQYPSNFVVGAGTFNLSVRDAQSCQVNFMQSLYDPPKLIATLTPKAPLCFGDTTGMLVVKVTGGTPPYSYRLEPNATVGSTAFGLNNTFVNLASGLYQVTVKDSLGCQTFVQTTIKDPATTSFLATFTLTPVSCTGTKDGIVTVAASGGAPGYLFKVGATSKYQENNQFFNITPGVYYAYAIDTAGCERRSNPLNVIDPSPLKAGVPIVTDTTCFGESDGIIELPVSGGSTPYSYSVTGRPFSFFNKFTSLSVGNYTVNIHDSHGCVIPPFELEVEGATSVLTATTKTTMAKCGGAVIPDGSIVVTPSGGMPPYLCSLDSKNFTSSCSFYNVSGGTHTINVRDAYECDNDISVTVPQNPPLIVSGTVTTQIYCYQALGAIKLTAIGGVKPYTYQIEGFANSSQSSTTFTDLPAGSYVFTVTDAVGCVAKSASVMLDQPSLLMLTTSSVTPPCDFPSGSISAAASGGVPPYSYSIGGNASITGEFGGLSQGNYTVTVTDANQCITTQKVVVRLITNDILAYAVTSSPPCFGGNTGTLNVVATGSHGPFRFQLNENPLTTSPNFTGLHAGVYYVTVKDVNDCIYTVTDISITQPRALGTVPTVAAPSCSGGSDGRLRINAYGGTLPYAYTVDGVPSNSTVLVRSGMHNMTVVDANNCSIFTQQYVADTPVLSSNLLAHPVQCYGQANGYITVRGIGGTPPYTYSLNGVNYGVGTFYDLAPGTYSVKITDSKGCFVTQSAHIAEAYGLLNISATAPALSCIGEKVNMEYDIVGGQAPFNISVFPDAGVFKSRGRSGYFSLMPVGNYTVFVTDGYGCQAKYSINISDPAPLNIQFSPAIPLTSVQLAGTSDYHSDAIVQVSAAAGAPIKSFFLRDPTQRSNMCSDGSNWTASSNRTFASETGEFAGLPPGTLSLYALTTDLCLVKFTDPIAIYTPTVAEAPASPILDMDLGNRVVHIYWTAPNENYSPIESYDIQFISGLDCSGTAPTDIPWTSVSSPIPANSSQYDMIVAFGVCYYIRIAAINAAGTGPYSDENFASAADAPRTPKNLIVQNIPQGLALSWTAPDLRKNETIIYDVDVKIQNGSSYFIAAANLTEASYTMASLTIGTSYTVRVRAVNAIFGLIGSWSAEAAGVALEYPSAPQNFVVTSPTIANSLCIKASWTAPAYSGGATKLKYVLEMSSSATAWITVNSNCTTCTTVTLCSNLIYSTTYSFRLTAYNAFPSPSLNATIKYGVNPKPITNLQVTSRTATTTASVTLTWTDAVVTGPLPNTYTITDDASNVVKTGLTSPTFTLRLLTLGANLTFCVSTVNAMGSSDPVCFNFLAAALPARPIAPLCGTVVPRRLDVSLFPTWNQLLDAETGGIPVLYYRLVYSAGGPSFTIDAANTTAEIAGLDAQQITVVQVAGCNAVGCGPFSSFSSCALLIPPPSPAAPLVYITMINATSKTIQVDWNQAPDYADGNTTEYYLLQHSASTNVGLWETLDTFIPDILSVPSYSFTYQAPILKTGVTHSFRVSAVNPAGTSPPSIVVSERIVHTPPRPSINNVFVLVGENSTCNVMVTWTGDTSNGGYVMSYNPVWDISNVSTVVVASTRAMAYGLQVGLQYDFRVTAFVSYENGVPVDYGVPSYTVTQYTAVAPFDKVTDLQPRVDAPTPEFISISWLGAAPTGLQAWYNVYVSSFDPLVDVTVPPLTLYAQNVTENTFYLRNYTQARYFQFAVQSVNQLGQSKVSLPSKAVYAGPLPDPPTQVSITGFVANVNGTFATDISFNGTAGLTFMMQYAIDENATEWVSVEGPCCNFVIPDLPQGVVLHVFVLAENPRGISRMSEMVNATVMATPGLMLRPTIVSKFVNGPTTLVNVSWLALDTTSTYKIEHSLYTQDIHDKNAYSWVIDASAATGESLEVSLPTSAQYVFRVTAHSAAGYGTPSFPSKPVLTADVPDTVIGLSHYLQLVSPLGVSIQFSPPNSRGEPILFYAAYYTILPADPAEAALAEPVTGVVMIPAGNETVNASLPAYNGWEYRVAVIAQNNVGESIPANVTFVLGVAPVFAPSPPMFGTVTVQNYKAEFTIDWNIDYGDTGVSLFTIEISNDAEASWTQYGTVVVSAKGASPTFSNGTCSYVPFSTVLSCSSSLSVPSGKVYSVRVGSSNYFGKSPTSAGAPVIAAVPPVFYTPDAPQFTSVDLGSKIVSDMVVQVLSADDGGDAAGLVYVLAYTIDPMLVGPWVEVGRSHNGTFYILNVTLGQVYTFRSYPQNMVDFGSSVYARFIPAVAPDNITTLTISEVVDISMRVDFDIPLNGGVPLFSYTVNILQEFINGSQNSYSVVYPAKYADLRPNNRNSLLIYVKPNCFYSFSIMPTNANNLSATGFSPTSGSYFATYYVFRKITPNFNTIAGGAIASLIGDTIPYTPRLLCKFGNEYTKGTPRDKNAVETTIPLCTVPKQSAIGTVAFSFSPDGLLWSNAVNFTYYGPVGTFTASPVAGPVSGGTIITFSAENLIYTQTVNCYFGTKYSAAQFDDPTRTYLCVSPVSIIVSPPATNLYVVYDNQPQILMTPFYYYVNPTLAAVKPKHINYTSIGSSISVGGDTFVATGERARVRIRNDAYGSFYSFADYKSKTTMVFPLMTLPGEGLTYWFLSMSLDAGQHWTNEWPITVRWPIGQCKFNDCLLCQRTPGCIWVKSGTLGASWCQEPFPASYTPDAIAPRQTFTCEGDVYINSEITPIPIEMFKLGSTIVYKIKTVISMRFALPEVSGPIMSYSCKGADTWVPTNPGAVFRLQSRAKFIRYKNFESDQLEVECHFILPISTPLDSYALLGNTVQLLNDSTGDIYYTQNDLKQFFLRPYGRILNPTAKNRPMKVLRGAPYNPALTVYSQIIGQDFLLEQHWEEPNFRERRCSFKCDYSFDTNFTPVGVYPIKMYLNGWYQGETGYQMVDFPKFIRDFLEFFGLLPEIKKYRSLEGSLEEPLATDLDLPEYLPETPHREIMAHTRSMATRSKYGDDDSGIADIDSGLKLLLIALPKKTTGCLTDPAYSYCLPYIEFYIPFPPFAINSMVQVEFEPFDGKYGMRWEGGFTLAMSADGTFTAGGGMAIAIAAKNEGSLEFEVLCDFDVGDKINFKQCVITVDGLLKFCFPANFGVVSVTLCLGPALHTEIYINSPEVDTKHIGFLINGGTETIYGKGYAVIIIELDVGIGIGIFGVEVNIAVGAGIAFQFSRAPHFVRAIQFIGEIGIKICVLFCAGPTLPFQFKAQLYPEDASDAPDDYEPDPTSSDDFNWMGKRDDSEEPVRPSFGLNPGIMFDKGAATKIEYFMETGNYKSRFVHNHKRALRSVEPQTIIEDLYPANHLRLYELTAGMKSLVLGLGFYNQTSRPGSALTVIYSVYDHNTELFVEPKPVAMDEVAEHSPSAALWSNNVYVVAWTRTATWQGVNTTDYDQLTAWGRTAEVVWATYDAANDKWSSIAPITQNNPYCNLGVNLATFTTSTNAKRVMAVYFADVDGDLMYTQTDRAYFYTIYNGNSWSTPRNMSFYGNLGETSMATNKDTLVFTFSAPIEGSGFGKIMYAVYNITTDTWSSAQPMYNLNYEILPGNATDNVAEADAQVVVHEGKFVMSWQRNQTGLYRVWTPQSRNEPPSIFTDTNLAINFAKLATYGKGTIADPAYTVFIYSTKPRSSSSGKASSRPTVSLALMESGDNVFGATVSYPFNENYALTYQDILLVPSPDANKIPAVVQLFTQATRYETPDGNSTFLADHELVYRVVEINPDIKISGITIDPVDATSLNVQFTVLNEGLISTSANQFNVTFVEGTYTGRNYSIAPITQIALGSIASSATQVYSFSWTPSDSFPGYLYGFTINTQTGEEQNEVHKPLYSLSLAKPSYAGRVENDSTLIDITVDVVNSVSFASGSVEVPVLLYTKSLKTSVYSLLRNSTVKISGNSGVATINFEVPEVEVTGTFAVLVDQPGTRSVTYKVNIPNVELTPLLRLPVSNNVDLVLTNPSQITVTNSIAASAVISVSIINQAVFSAHECVITMYRTNLTEIPTGNMSTIAKIATISPLNQVGSESGLTLFGLNTATVSLTATPEVGTAIYCFLVTTQSTDVSTRDNQVCLSLTFTPQVYLQVDVNEIDASAENGTVTIVAYNFGGDDGENITLPLYHVVNSTSSVLIGTTEVFSVPSSSVQKGVVRGLVNEFSGVDPHYYDLLLVIPAQYTSDAADHLLTFTLESALNQQAPDLLYGVKLFAPLDITVQRSIQAYLGEELHLPVIIKNFNSLYANSVSLSLDHQQEVITLEPSLYTTTGQASVRIFADPSLIDLDPSTGTAYFTNNITLASNGTLVTSAQVDITINACHPGMVVCKDLTCAVTVAACAVHNSLCQLTRPILHNGVCLSSADFYALPGITSFSITLLSTQAHKVYFPNSKLNVNIPMGALSAYGTNVGVSLSYENSNAFASTVLSEVITIAVVGQAKAAFAAPVSISFPYDSKSSLSVKDDIEVLCLGIYNSTSQQWKCIDDGKLVVEEGKKRAPSGIAASTKYTGKLAVIVNSKAAAEKGHHRHINKLGVGLGVTFGVLALAAIVIAGYIYYRKRRTSVDKKTAAAGIQMTDLSKAPSYPVDPMVDPSVQVSTDPNTRADRHTEYSANDL